MLSLLFLCYPIFIEHVNISIHFATRKFTYCESIVSNKILSTQPLYTNITLTHTSDQRSTGMIVICMEYMVIVAMTSVALSSVLKTQFKTFQKLSYPFDEPPFL